MAAWDAQVSLAKFAVEHTHRCTYLMMISYCRGFAMLSRKEALFSFLCLKVLPCASPRLSPRLVLDFCLYVVRGLFAYKIWRRFRSPYQLKDSLCHYFCRLHLPGHPSLPLSITRDRGPDSFLVEFQQYSWEGGSCIARLKPTVFKPRKSVQDSVVLHQSLNCPVQYSENKWPALLMVDTDTLLPEQLTFDT